MEDDSKYKSLVKGGLGVLGLGVVASVFAIPKYGIWIALAILVLALLLFGGYYLWQRTRERRQSENFRSAIEAQTSAVPKNISDPNKRAALDRLRQKFQTGLQEFKSRGKDIYKLPWYVIIGESGSGKSEAIRRSGIDFARGLQDEFQGSGGTVNMDWWFTNRGIILDTAGSMIFTETRAGEVPEWREFLRLLKKSRPHNPINGLFLVLSVESLIKDSSEKIAQKASILAQQLELIQRTLDVRFPVYLLVTKCDLLTGFREFFDSIDDPLLQHQMFGWSNPDPLDAAFRPDVVDQHLSGVAERLRRRRLALLRETSLAARTGDTARFYTSSFPQNHGRRLDEVDSMFALSESMMRLAPRLRRYLETVFVAGEWSAKPVFLRGIYFTSSMREGKALDEAIAFATGLSLDQLPENRSWEKNRAFFLRDLFHEKVFRESGLVTHATNTLQLLRQRKLVVFGTSSLALLALLLFAFFAFRNLQNSVLRESEYWQAGAVNWNQGEWSPAIVNVGDSFRFGYGGTNIVPGTGNLKLVQYHERLGEIAGKPLAVNWIFKPMAWVNLGAVRDRAKAQRLLFEGGVVKPLFFNTRAKMIQADPPFGGDDALARHRDALIALINLEYDERAGDTHAFAENARPEKYLKSMLAYLIGTNMTPDPLLVNAFANTYSKESLAKNGGVWPPKYLPGGDLLASNLAIEAGLEKFQKASLRAQTNILENLKLVDDFADKLGAYQVKEAAWLANTTEACAYLERDLVPAKAAADASWNALAGSTNFPVATFTNLTVRYRLLAASAMSASASNLKGPLNRFLLTLPGAEQGHGLLNQIHDKLNELAGQAADSEMNSFNIRHDAITMVDANCLTPTATNNAVYAYLTRWQIYLDACSLDSQIGFPVLLNSTKTMSLAELHNSRKLLTGLSTALQSLAAQNYPVVGVMQKSRDGYDSVVTGLANDDGTAANWELWFVPPDRDNSDDRAMLTIFPFVEVSAGGNPVDSDNLTRATAPVLLGKFTTDQGLKITFNRFVSHASQEPIPGQTDWALVRLIQDYKAKRQNDGKTWRFKVPLKDTGHTGKSGDFTFEIRLSDARQALPAIADWPTQKR